MLDFVYSAYILYAVLAVLLLEAVSCGGSLHFLVDFKFNLRVDNEL